MVVSVEAGDRRDRGKRLAAETERGDADQIGRAPDLAGGVAVQREDRVLPSHAGAVVAHRDERLAALLQLDPHVARAGVERVLHQLLDHRGGPLHHLARGDLVGDGVGQDRDAAGHRENLAAHRRDRLVREPALRPPGA